jgi:hypothetical protein
VIAGPVLFARYAYAPNALGYCGPGDSGALLEYAGGRVCDAGLVALAKQFAGAWPYLALIANVNGIGDPLDARVVRAYWLGSPLLERAPGRLFAAHVVDRFTDRTAGNEVELAELALVGRAHHNFHVFAVYPWVGLLRAGHVEAPMRVLQSCRIRWGTVTSVHSGRITVESPPLWWTGSELTLGPLQPETVQAAVPVHVGDVVSLHWDWVCERLTRSRAASLKHYTHTQLEVANRALGRPVADLVLG